MKSAPVWVQHSLPKLQTGCLFRDKEVIIALQNSVRPQWTALQWPMSVGRADLICIPMLLPLHPKNRIVAKNHTLQKSSPNNRQVQFSCGLSMHGDLIHIQVPVKQNYSGQSGRNNCKCRWVMALCKALLWTLWILAHLILTRAYRIGMEPYLLLVLLRITSHTEIWGTEQSLPLATERWRSWSRTPRHSATERAEDPVIWVTKPLL